MMLKLVLLILGACSVIEALSLNTPRKRTAKLLPEHLRWTQWSGSNQQQLNGAYGARDNTWVSGSSWNRGTYTQQGVLSNSNNAAYQKDDTDGMEDPNGHTWKKRLASCKNGNKFLKKKIKTLKQKYKEKLQAVKNIVNGILDDTLQDLSSPLKDFCVVKNEIIRKSGETLMNDGMGNQDDPCELSPWGQWHALAFNTIERTRYVVREGCGCPPDEELIERVDLGRFLGNGSSGVFQDTNTVGGNFDNDFLNGFGNNSGINGGSTTGDSTKVRDILMVLDSSGSIESDDFDFMKEGLVTMISLFCDGFGPLDSNNRLAIVQFASNVTIIHRFRDSQNPNDLMAKVMELKHYKGNTCTGNALQKSMLEVFTRTNGMRDFTVKDTLIVTDGKSNCGVNITRAALSLQEISNVYALGVGISGNVQARAEVKSVVSNENPRHIFSLSKFGDFKSMVLNLKRRHERNNPCTRFEEP